MRWSPRAARVERRLAAILATCRRLFAPDQTDEEGPSVGSRRCARTVDPKIAGQGAHRQDPATVGSFASVVETLAARPGQAAQYPSKRPSADRRIEFGLWHPQGDIVVEDGDIFGDSVSVRRLRDWPSRWHLRLARVREDLQVASTSP